MGGGHYYKAQDKYLSKLDGVKQGRASEAENDSGSSGNTLSDWRLLENKVLCAV